jgi:hypothetical protein
LTLTRWQGFHSLREVVIVTQVDGGPDDERLHGLLEDPDASVRLRAAMAAGMRPAPGQVELLVRRCAVEPDAGVRDMLTWALTRHDRAATVDRLFRELRSELPAARGQALHTLSKIGDRAVWPSVPAELLHDPDDDVARAAWRAAVVLVPLSEASALAERLATQLGRGDADTWLSLSRALIALGEASTAALARARTDSDDAVRAHARATERLAQDPGEGRALAVAEAARVRALRGAPLVDD